MWYGEWQPTDVYLTFAYSFVSHKGNVQWASLYFTNTSVQPPNQFSVPFSWYPSFFWFVPYINAVFGALASSTMNKCRAGPYPKDLHKRLVYVYCTRIAFNVLQNISVHILPQHTGFRENDKSMWMKRPADTVGHPTKPYLLELHHESNYYAFRWVTAISVDVRSSFSIDVFQITREKQNRVVAKICNHNISQPKGNYKTEGRTSNRCWWYIEAVENSFPLERLAFWIITVFFLLLVLFSFTVGGDSFNRKRWYTALALVECVSKNYF